ncbi:glycerophosphoryl diester phosphodiesterase membrane domain-containing protein [Cellulomonas sp. ATA003]|uniref:glycerophosphoryl diester phosphodiesterase membrane domain-containing protein n=1 Tax=Cellulomonas sp. ATA003 TaxID=3073064 RepID=UPI0028736274|nr:glycerophosphoryl diester phosphodiesterase membrane domain-containing protein [Cellulomonas sp. ATA003]WNB86369.1 glycerophosphoryl diester phosphodiesterase membrane domain-containing protein [Cellulomonas sp. ATA003]
MTAPGAVTRSAAPVPTRADLCPPAPPRGPRAAIEGAAAHDDAQRSDDPGLVLAREPLRLRARRRHAGGPAGRVGVVGRARPAPVPPGGWGPGYTSPTAGPPGYGPGSAPPLPGPAGPPPPPGGYPGAAGGRPPYGYAPPAPRPGIIPLRPLGLGEILDGAFRAIRANPRVMFGLSAVVVAITVAIQAVLQWYVTGLLVGELSRFASTVDPTGEFGLAETFAPTLAAAATTPLVSISVTVLTGLLIVSVSRSVIGQKISVGEVWSQAWRRVLLLVVFSFVTTLLVIAAWAGWGALLALLASTESWGAMAAVALLGGLALLAATAWFAVRILLIPASLVLEGTAVWTAIRRGWRLTRGTFWRLLGIYLLTTIMVTVVTSIIVTPAATVAGFVLDDPLLTSFGGIAVTSIANIIAYTLTTSFMAAVLALLYVDVRMRKEGLDVELARAAGEA